MYDKYPDSEGVNLVHDYYIDHTDLLLPLLARDKPEVQKSPNINGFPREQSLSLTQENLSKPDRIHRNLPLDYWWKYIHLVLKRDICSHTCIERYAYNYLHTELRKYFFSQLWLFGKKSITPSLTHSYTNCVAFCNPILMFRCGQQRKLRWNADLVRYV